MLHVTNGDHAAGQIREAGIAGEVLAWRDVLHEGPVPAKLPSGQLRQVRARFLAAQRWGDRETILRDLEMRDAAVAAAERITLWFEHDLFDQLQLLQVLNALADRPGAVWLVQATDYLGLMPPAQVAALYPTRRLVSPDQWALARRAWGAFGASSAEPLGALVRQDLSALPWLAGALRRHLEDLPRVGNGLSRSEQQVLEVIAAGAGDSRAAFAGWQQREDPIWMGDAGFSLHLGRLGGGPAPLLAGGPDALRLTTRGHEVRAGKADWVRLGGVDRWWGGVHLTGTDIPWRWDPASESVRVSLPPPG